MSQPRRRALVESRGQSQGIDSISAQPPMTSATTIAASGKYIRRSAPASVAIGITVDDGASVTKNHVPRKASSRRFRQAAAVITSRTSTTAADGRAALNETARGGP